MWIFMEKGIMKKIVALIVFTVVSYSFCAVYLDEGFESGTLDNVTVSDNDGDSSNWMIASDPEGGYYAVSSSDGLTPDNEMIFPSTWLELDAFLNYQIGGSDANYPEHYEIYIANDNIDPANFILIKEETIYSGELNQVEISLKPYLLQLDEWFVEGNVSVKIRHYNTSPNSQSSLIIDDFRLIYYPTFIYDEYCSDITVGIIEPYKTVNMRWTPYDRTAYDQDWNFIGLDNAVLHYIFTDQSGSYPEATIPLVINPDPNYEETYTVSVDGQPMGTKMEFWVVAVDRSGYNLTGTSEHFSLEWGEVNFDEGFEYSGPEVTPPDGWLPDGWTAFQTGEVTSSWDKPWEVDVPMQNVRTGEYSCTSAAQNNFGVWETIDYLVSPRLRVNGTPTLKYFANAQTKAGDQYKERWTVLISTVEGDGTDIENFKEVKTDSIIPNAENLNTWYEKVISLEDYTDQYIRIMWKHKYTSTAVKLDRFLNIDDVSIAEMPKISGDIGNAAKPDEDYILNLTVTDFSGISEVMLYYTIKGQSEVSLLMNDNGNGTFTGIIPAQSENSRCTWYVIAKDNTVYLNSTTSEKYEFIWFDSGCLEWGSDYSDYPDPVQVGYKIGTDWNFGEKVNLYLNKIEVGFAYDAPDQKWKLVQFDTAPTDKVIGELSGTYSFKSGGDALVLDGNRTPVGGHVALLFDSLKTYNEIMLDESGNKAHSWQWDQSNGWTTNLWGAFYIRLYVSQTVGIEDEFVSTTTELCQNYPNPFNPETSISFYNRIPGVVSLSVFNVKGENVKVLLNEYIKEGFRKINFNAQSLNSGVYYYTLKTPEKTLTRKMILLK
jgi:hypothetical protein